MKDFHLLKEFVYTEYCSPRTLGKLLFQEGEQALIKSVIIPTKISKPLTMFDKRFVNSFLRSAQQVFFEIIKIC